MFASISAAQSDDEIADNEVLHSITVTENTDTPDPSRNVTVDNTETSTETSGGNSGGGSLSLSLILLFGASRRFYQNKMFSRA